jgi:hypothetical protein
MGRLSAAALLGRNAAGSEAVGMGTHEAGTFEIEAWDGKPYDEREEAWPSRTRVAKTCLR